MFAYVWSARKRASIDAWATYQECSAKTTPSLLGNPHSGLSGRDAAPAVAILEGTVTLDDKGAR